MKVVVTGSRDWTNKDLIYNELMRLPIDTTIIHGGARGADTIAGELAKKFCFEVIEVPANWKKYRNAAGPIRNREMLDMEPDLVLAFPLPESKGTKDCMKEARRRGIALKVVTDER